MSTRSIVEINHDYTHEIADNPVEFVQALRIYLNDPNEPNAKSLLRFGMIVAWSGHHSEDRHILMTYWGKVS